MTGLEPATSGVTGQRSNQLSYTPCECRNSLKPSDSFSQCSVLTNLESPPTFHFGVTLRLAITSRRRACRRAIALCDPSYAGGFAEARGGWWVMTGSNCRPPRCKRGALPTELITQRPACYIKLQRFVQPKIPHFLAARKARKTTKITPKQKKGDIRQSRTSPFPKNFKKLVYSLFQRLSGFKFGPV